MPDKVKAGYSQSAKVTSPANQYENATFMVSGGFETEIESLSPEATKEEAALWKEKRNKVFLDDVATLRDLIEREIQKDVDQFIEDNTVTNVKKG